MSSWRPLPATVDKQPAILDFDVGISPTLWANGVGLVGILSRNRRSRRHAEGGNSCRTKPPPCCYQVGCTIMRGACARRGSTWSRSLTATSSPVLLRRCGLQSAACVPCRNRQPVHGCLSNGRSSGIRALATRAGFQAAPRRLPSRRRVLQVDNPRLVCPSSVIGHDVHIIDSLFQLGV